MSSPQTTTQVSKAKKIEWYAGHLMTGAVAKENSGRLGDAIVDYLQAADLLLLLAKVQDNYTVWKGYTDRALACQQRVKILMAKRRLEEEKASQSA